MKKPITLLILFLLTTSNTAGARDDMETTEVTEPSVIKVKFVEKRCLKPPLCTFYVQLSVKNAHKNSVWYITRYWGDSPLAKDKPFKAKSPWKRGYEIPNDYHGDRFEGKGKFRTTSFIGTSPPGKDNHSFVAFRLPPGGTLKHDYFPIESWSDIASIEIWEASSLLVNGEIPFEDWLPYEVTSSEETYITKKAARWVERSSVVFQWKKGMNRDDYPKQEVKAIIPDVLTKQILPIKGIGKKEDPPPPPS